MCCAWMQNSIQIMNESGITTVPRRRLGADYFAVRFRIMDPGKLTQLSSHLPVGTPFTSAAEMAINHCPGCGASLAGWIVEHPDEFEILLGQVID